MLSEKIKKPKVIQNYLEVLESPRFFTTPFSWLYLVLAAAFIALPIFVLTKGIDAGVFKVEGNIPFAFVLVVLAAFIAGIVSAFVALNGQKKVSLSKLTIDFIVAEIAELIALCIKSVAHFIGIFGFFAGLIALIFAKNILYYLPGVDVFGSPVYVMVGSLLLGYALVWFSKLVKFLFTLLVMALIVRPFKFIVFYAISKIYNFIAHIIKQFFDYGFMVILAFVDFMVNGLRVVVALVARFGRFLLAYAQSPFENKDLNNVKVTYNE